MSNINILAHRLIYASADKINFFKKLNYIIKGA